MSPFEGRPDQLNQNVWSLSMQFQSNADYPDDSDPTGPLEFPAAQPVPCARITTRIFHPNRQQVATVQNVLVRTVLRQNIQRTGSDSSMSSNFSESSAEVTMHDASDTAVPSETNRRLEIDSDADDRAYWIQRTIREAIYGRVFFAIVLKRRNSTTGLPNDNAEWEVTGQRCAVKEMSWQHIRRERDRLAEDPIKEVSAMQYLQQWVHHNSPHRNSLEGLDDGVARSFYAMRATNIMMPLDLLSDDRNLYSIMPFCDGGELFERLDLNERFPEAETRYWMGHILNGIETMQNAGICHRDMSLENLLVHQNGALVIDMGMCLRIPFRGAPPDLATSFGDLSMNGGNSSAPSMSDQGFVTNRKSPRALLSPQGTCGKWIYMSPEVYRNKDPFDGFAIDMWAVGVILFLMLTGFPPWERACQTDERFKYMTAGYLVQMLTEWEIGISPDGMDLLQRMLFLDPKDRLSLDQVRAHPWMVNGPVQEPPAERPS